MGPRLSTRYLNILAEICTGHELLVWRADLLTVVARLKDCYEQFAAWFYVPKYRAYTLADLTEQTKNAERYGDSASLTLYYFN
jgi:hypothetical protein